MISQLQQTGFFGSGPHELAQLSRGQEMTLLAPQRLPPVSQYYGVPGLVALLLLVVDGGVSLALSRSRATLPRALWTTGITSFVALVLVALVDFRYRCRWYPPWPTLRLGPRYGRERYANEAVIGSDYWGIQSRSRWTRMPA